MSTHSYISHFAGKCIINDPFGEICEKRFGIIVYTKNIVYYFLFIPLPLILQNGNNGHVKLRTVARLTDNYTFISFIEEIMSILVNLDNT